MRAIKASGFTPRIAPRDRDRGLEPEPPAEIPDPIARALAEAGASGRPLFVDFYADWCAPCKTLEAEIMRMPAVERALLDYVSIRVDTYRFPEAGRSYDIAVPPTLLILDSQGKERSRLAGAIGPRRC